VRMTRPAMPVLMMAVCLSVAAIRAPVPAKHMPKQTPCPPNSSGWVTESLLTSFDAGQLTILGFISLVASLLLFPPADFPHLLRPEVTRIATGRRRLSSTASDYAEDWDVWLPEARVIGVIQPRRDRDSTLL
jgi:hypothetical protein